MEETESKLEGDSVDLQLEECVYDELPLNYRDHRESNYLSPRSMTREYYCQVSCTA